jgi:hypothetical protein
LTLDGLRLLAYTYIGRRYAISKRLGTKSFPPRLFPLQACVMAMAMHDDVVHNCYIMAVGPQRVLLCTSVRRLAAGHQRFSCMAKFAMHSCLSSLLHTSTVVVGTGSRRENDLFGQVRKAASP